MSVTHPVLHHRARWWLTHRASKTDTSQSSKVYMWVPEKANTHLSPGKALSYCLLSKVQLSAQLQRRTPQILLKSHLLLFDIALLQREVGCPKKVSPPNTRPAIPCHAPSWENPMQHHDQVDRGTKPGLFLLLCSGRPFAFGSFCPWQRAKPRPLFLPPPCSFPPALAFWLLNEEIRRICPFPPHTWRSHAADHLCVLSPPLNPQH